MLAVFDYLLRGIGSKVRIGKGGPLLKGDPSGVELRLPDDTGFARLKVGEPESPNDAINLIWVRDHVLSSWNTPVQNLIELKAIPSIERKDKQIREVEDELSFYQFDSESFAVSPDTVDPSRTILPNDLTSSLPGRWIKTTSRAQLHSQLLGLGVGDDHPQYQRRNEKNSPLGFPGLSEDAQNPGIQIVSGGSVVSTIKSLASSARSFLLPDKSGTLATDEIFIGSSETFSGTKGLVPAPGISDRERFLSGDGTWKTNFGSLKNSEVISSVYTANKYERVLVETANNSVLITLPQNPQDNTVIGILDLSNHAGTNPITLQRNGQRIEGFEEDWQLDLDGGYWELAYSIERGGWFFLSNPSYNNVSPSSNFLTDSPTFSEISLAPSARAVKEYVDTKDLNFFQTLATIGTEQIGSGHMPAGTLVKKAWFEGVTDTLGHCTISTGLGNSIAGLNFSIKDSLGQWVRKNNMTAFHDDQGHVGVQATDSEFWNKPVRFWIEYK
ncbi:hypothetical protein LFX25_20430 [Leptospira sp. FAT2]|uniref:hypothetical protein n=1 Tax=Leptospira sanjuanensis TaxID=2879643 RepID=UPI001EE97FE0|nr:hypothetical protein [Leptospira sanjuanensis]MCG6195613.1 hypothetical protein [Leptospira sanjuanensis]